VPFIPALLAILLGLSTATATGDPADEHFHASRTWGSSLQTYGAALIDFDGDGLPDPFLNWHRDRPPTVLRNRGDMTFSRPDIPWIFPMDRHGCAWGEANGDRSPDLYCSRGAQHGTGSGPKELWSTNPWNEWGATAGIDNPMARGRSVNWLDYDRDGDLDLFTGAAQRDGYGDQLFRNDGGSFTPVVAGVSGPRSTVMSTTADWNGDGWPDLLLLEGTDGNTLRAFRNDHGTFVRTQLANSSGTWRSAAWGDYDGDGWPDLSLIALGRSLILRNDHGTFRPVSKALLVRGRASVWLDVNNDGLLDLYVVQSAAGMDPGSIGDATDQLLMQSRAGTFQKLFLSETTGWAGAGQSVATGDVNDDHRVDVLVSNGRNRWLGSQHLLVNRVRAGGGASLVLRGTRWNPLGFGARVRVTIGGRIRWIELNDMVSALSQSSAVVSIGMGNASSAWVRVRWPNGVCDQLKIQRGTTRRLPIGTAGC
jgi:hypothetical protein